jgi:hypothetical protein
MQKRFNVVLIFVLLAYGITTLFLPVSYLIQFHTLHPEIRTFSPRSFISHFSGPPSFFIMFLLYVFSPALIVLQTLFIRRPFRWYITLLFLCQIAFVLLLTFGFYTMMTFDLHIFLFMGTPTDESVDYFAIPSFWGWLIMGINTAIILTFLFIVLKPKSRIAGLFGAKDEF